MQRLLHRHLATAFSAWHEQLVILAALKVDGEAAARKMMAARTAYLLHHWQVQCPLTVFTIPFAIRSEWSKNCRMCYTFITSKRQKLETLLGT